MPNLNTTNLGVNQQHSYLFFLIFSNDIKNVQGAMLFERLYIIMLFNKPIILTHLNFYK